MVEGLRPIGDVAVLDLTGQLCLGADTLRQLRDVIDGQLNSGNGFRKFLLNLRRIKKVDDIGAGELEKVAWKVLQLGGEIRFLNLTSSGVKDPRLLAKLAMIAPYHDDEATAVRSFR